MKFGVAFMDLSAAYDSIDRNLLFTKLKRMGMSDHSINTLRHLYQDTTCIVKCDQGGSARFTVNIGLRQGCPLSTTLFNPVIWDLHQHLVTDTHDAGARMQGARMQGARMQGARMQGVADGEQLLVTNMEYADDATPKPRIRFKSPSSRCRCPILEFQIAVFPLNMSSTCTVDTIPAVIWLKHHQG
jgi:hypothetical protein